MNTSNKKILVLVFLVLLVVLGSILNYYEYQSQPYVTIHDDVHKNNNNCKGRWWKLGEGTHRKYQFECDGVDCKKVKMVEVGPKTTCVLAMKCSTGKCPDTYVFSNNKDHPVTKVVEEFVDTPNTELTSINVIGN